MTDPTHVEDLELIGRFLARRDVESLEVESLDRDGVGRRFDVLVLCGSAVLASVEVAARAFHDGIVDRILVTGGVGHSTSHLEAAVHRHPRYSDVPTAGRPEAEVFAEILRRHLQVPDDAIDTETESTNCGENAELSLHMMASWPSTPFSALLVQDPTMQRRTHAAFDRHQQGAARPVTVVSYAPFIPVVTDDGVGGKSFSSNETDKPGVAWTLARFTSLVLGEVRRLHDTEEGYGPRGAGFIGHVDVPDDVLAAYHRLRATTRPEIRER